MVNRQTTESSTEEELRKTPWGDVQLLGLSWIEEARDLAFRVLLPGAEPDRDQLLVCRWVHGLVVNLKFGLGQGGYPLTWDTSFSREANGTWLVHFDFAHTGEVRLRCNEIEFAATAVR